MDFEFALAQDIGTRSEQQDSAAVCPFPGVKGALLVIADGLGGHTGGARASHIAVKTFADAGESGRFATSQDRFEQLGLALSAANVQIGAAAQVLAKNETMGTTLVAAAAAWNSLGWISVGDSHLYLWRAGQLTKLNEDHSQAGQMLKTGKYKPDDPELDPYRSMLRSAIMGRELTLIDRPIATKDLERGDVIVLATDGLNIIELPQVERMIGEHAAKSADGIANALLDAVRASTAPSRDNATVIVARVTALDGDAQAAPDAEAPDKSAADNEENVTTAIVTTPYFRTGQTQSRPRRVDAGLAPQGDIREFVAELPQFAETPIGGATPATSDTLSAADALPLPVAPPPAAAPPVSVATLSNPTSAATAGGHRWLPTWFWLALIGIASGAALALAFQRGLLER